MGHFRIAKRFVFDAGHRLSKHPELCRFPHGHTYEIEVVLRAERLDQNDMVCDYAALKAVARREVAGLDHSMMLSASDPDLASFAPFSERLVVFDEGDPTTETLARRLFERIRANFRSGLEVTSESGAVYRVPEGVTVERVRVWETPTSWAEFGEGTTGE
jgi:6-pyruvoyltetrahydropterin/6-carboxytetrahydropterin synthase